MRLRGPLPLEQDFATGEHRSGARSAQMRRKWAETLIPVIGLAPAFPRPRRPDRVSAPFRGSPHQGGDRRIQAAVIAARPLGRRYNCRRHVAAQFFDCEVEEGFGARRQHAAGGVERRPSVTDCGRASASTWKSRHRLDIPRLRRSASSRSRALPAPIASRRRRRRRLPGLRSGPRPYSPRKSRFQRNCCEPGKRSSRQSCADEVARRLWRAAPGDIGGRSAEHALDLGDLAQRKTRILHPRQPDRQIDALLHDVEDMVGEPQPHFRSRLLLSVARDHRRDDAPAEPERRGDPQHALGRSARWFRRRSPRRARPPRRSRGNVRERPRLPPSAACCGSCASAGARRACLPATDAIADHRGRQPQHAPGRRERAGLNGAQENPDVFEGYHAPI